MNVTFKGKPIDVAGYVMIRIFCGDDLVWLSAGDPFTIDGEPYSLVGWKYDETDKDYIFVELEQDILV